MSSHVHGWFIQSAQHAPHPQLQRCPRHLLLHLLALLPGRQNLPGQVSVAAHQDLHLGRGWWGTQDLEMTGWYPKIAGYNGCEFCHIGSNIGFDPSTHPAIVNLHYLENLNGDIPKNVHLQNRCSESHRGNQRRNLDWGNRIEAQVLTQIYLPLRDILTTLQPARDRLASLWIWFLWFSLCNPIPTRYVGPKSSKIQRIMYEKKILICLIMFRISAMA